MGGTKKAVASTGLWGMNGLLEEVRFWKNKKTEKKKGGGEVLWGALIGAYLANELWITQDVIKDIVR